MEKIIIIGWISQYKADLVNNWAQEYVKYM